MDGQGRGVERTTERERRRVGEEWDKREGEKGGEESRKGEKGSGPPHLPECGCAPDCIPSF